ncbi:DUF3618 domain-containing protein [Streptomyces poriticola]|uniref:DUF3618 domain-containing protein n=1 Tax=Streptomyces poriticola TaxID=3120506 RepID=UPI002FCE0360
MTDATSGDGRGGAKGPDELRRQLRQGPAKGRAGHGRGGRARERDVPGPVHTAVRLGHRNPPPALVAGAAAGAVVAAGVWWRRHHGQH